MTESHHHQHNHQHDNSNGATDGPKLSDGLKKFLVGLASDVGKLTAFMYDQKKAFEDAGLTQEQQDLLLSGDQSRIYAALKDLPLPPPAAAQPPAQMPTVVAAMHYQGQTIPGAAPASGAGPAAGAAMAGAAAAVSATPQPQAGQQLPPYYVLQPSQMQPAQQAQHAQQVYGYQPIYYLVQWPSWPQQ
ncbi:hypothetical protein JQ604_37900 [Bradyrhizobium jicamae]|uniref:hypothetical protein n=1 Tax=Bradyrhizobium jicamae TaxID=280332 RepID=UPI001BAD1407|nr:hypothetical protein [Bradyrhizobium jicamae]MBR0757987.1 hypothetical protein [Bradyrhizobium jicamae]